MQNLLADHLERVKTAVDGVYGLGNLDRYIEKKTFLNGKPYSFLDHEFQLEVLRSQAPTDITVKIAQVGMSEVCYRLALAACRVIDDFSIIYTFPNASDAEKMCKTRIDPIINDSPDLRGAVNPNLNNSETKQFGRNSFLYMKGTRSESGAISVPADMIIHDEWDRSDTSVGSMYIARLQHKPYKLRKLFSTPTVKKFGILKEAETARRMRAMVRCACCNHRWLPDYFTDIKIPGYDGDLKDLNKSNIITVKWKKAYLACPRCGRDPKLEYANIEWVCENPNDAYEAVARFITPFCVPNILTPSYLVHNSTEYKRYAEFMNQGLGLAAEDSESSITEADLEAAIVDFSLDSSEVTCFAADMGLICHVMIVRLSQTGQMLVVHKERVPLDNFESRRRELILKYRCIVSVHDSQPYVDTIMRITQRDPNAYGAIFTTFKSGPVVRIQEQEEDAEEGKMNFRAVKIMRNDALDMLMAVIKRRELLVARNAETDTWKEHMQSLKRIQKFNQHNELVYVWEKTGEEVDHYHFTLLYAWVALKIRGTASITAGTMANVPIMSKVRMQRG